ncbi:MAG: inorganic phosphate transporter [Bacteroidota bacterium]|nr:inorganic phosphate transporter [Bacteroidota bacterium]
MSIYIFFLVVLFLLAISDLMVGVANDAVNFLNSAIGSKVATRRVIMIVASVGIMAGALFSNGMMEVARKGLFLPQYFLFTEIILIFLAVMFTDILLLDFFNTFGLPTSTTVSLVFGLLGAGVGMAFLKVGDGATIMVDGVEKIAQIGDFINSSKALAIISSILLSVVFSVIFGVAIQWISRLIFSFNTEKTIRYYGSLWGGVAISAITYFILIKGMKDASFMSKENYAIIKDNTIAIITGSFVLWALMLQLLNWLFKTNPLKIVVFAGTFALAMAFAGNDLVNFIGVPLAGFEAFKIYSANGGQDVLMGGLLAEIITPSYFLFGAGIIMVTVLWFSRKAQSVTETELKLSRQDEGSERFGSTAFSRVLVRKVVNTGTFFSHVIPQSVIDKIGKRFDKTELEESIKRETNPPMFDMVRASVNMMVAASLIAVGTSYKLPLSTTYVTFMVAMSTSLVDGAWGRDSAVYRITGVFTVIGGWFITGLAAFSVTLLLSIFLGWAQFIGVIILVGIVAFSFYRSNIIHQRRLNNQLETAEEVEESRSTKTLFEKCNNGITKTLTTINDLYNEIIVQLIKEDHKELKKQLKVSTQLEEKLNNKRNKLYQAIPTLPASESIEATHYYILTLDYLKEIAHCATFLVDPVYNHVDNNHKPLIASQAEELTKMAEAFDKFMKLVLSSIENNNQENLNKITAEHAKIIEMVKESRKNLIKTIKRKEVGTKTSMLVLSILSETRNILIYTVNMMKIQNDFTITVKEEK